MSIKSLLKQLYYSFHPHRSSIPLEYKVTPRPTYSLKRPHPELYELIRSYDHMYTEWLLKILKYKANFQSIPLQSTTRDQPYWNNGFLPGLDIMALYTIIAETRPKRYLEIGSGNSTKVAHKAKTDFTIDMNITSIDPFPRADIDHISDRIIRTPLEDLEDIPYSDLESGDVLFIDNSHRLFPNSDVMHVFLEILPRLQKGVLVQIHDIYLPYDYPQFMCDRYYSEQYALAIQLLADTGNRYQPFLPNFYISQSKLLNDNLLPIWSHDTMDKVEKHGGSFWFVIN